MLDRMVVIPAKANRVGTSLMCGFLGVTLTCFNNTHVLTEERRQSQGPEKSKKQL
jgi:hypothetical protein